MQKSFTLIELLDGYVFQKSYRPLIFTGGGTDLQVYWVAATGLPLGGGQYSDNYNDLGINLWHHIVVSWSNSNALRIYINGKIWKSYTGLNLPSSSDGYELGRYGGTNYFNGLFDEVRIYETALTLGQIQQHYAEGLKRHADLAIK